MGAETGEFTGGSRICRFTEVTFPNIIVTILPRFSPLKSNCRLNSVMKRPSATDWVRLERSWWKSDHGSCMYEGKIASENVVVTWQARELEEIDCSWFCRYFLGNRSESCTYDVLPNGKRSTISTVESIAILQFKFKVLISVVRLLIAIKDSKLMLRPSLTSVGIVVSSNKTCVGSSDGLGEEILKTFEGFPDSNIESFEYNEGANEENE